MPPTGWIRPLDRSLRQHSAHAGAAVQFVRHSLQPRQLDKGQKVFLWDFWKAPEVVADVGFVGSRWHQKTGSCVWAGGSCAVYSTICTQRMASDNPTKAFWPFTLHNYAHSRALFGDTGEGEGSLGSTFAQSLREMGIRDWPKDPADEMPEYTQDVEEGCIVGGSVEMRWSSIRNPNIEKVKAVSSQHLFGSTAECRSPQDVLAMITNGYGVSWACNNFISGAKVKGSGADAYCCSNAGADQSGGHQWSIQAVWNHPTDGLLFYDLNNWDKSTYPRCPSGAPIGGCWRTEKQLAADFRKDAECYGFSHLNYFPAQPRVLDYSDHV
jgi:hypothetical protein